MDNDGNVPGFTASPQLEAKLAGLDDNLQPITNDSPTEPQDKSTEEQPLAPEENDNKLAEDLEGEPDDKSDDQDDEGYTIDQDDEEVTETPTKEEPVFEKGNDQYKDLNPEQQYILKNIQAITVRGTVGTDEVVKEFQVLAPEQLPTGFKYVDDRELSTANKNFAILEQKAVQLQSDFRSQENTKSATAFKEAEDTADRTAIADLQKAGDIPKFKLQPSAAKFTDDPAAKLIQAVLDFKAQRNQQYLEESNQGKPYRHIGFEEALLMYERHNPVQADKQVQEDTEREQQARRTAGTRGDRSGNSNKPRVHSGMSSRDLDHLIDSLDWDK